MLGFKEPEELYKEMKNERREQKLKRILREDNTENS